MNDILQQQLKQIHDQQKNDGRSEKQLYEDRLTAERLNRTMYGYTSEEMSNIISNRKS